VDFIGWIIGALGLAFAVYEHIQRKRADARRDLAEAQRDRLQAAVEAPRLVVGYTGSRPVGHMPGVIIDLAVVNKGPTVASDVRFGLEIDDWVSAAHQMGSRSGVPEQMISALAPGERVTWSVVVKGEMVDKIRSRGLQPHHAITDLWAEYRDPRGDGHQRSYGFNTQL